MPIQINLLVICIIYPQHTPWEQFELISSIIIFWETQTTVQPGVTVTWLAWAHIGVVVVLL